MMMIGFGLLFSLVFLGLIACLAIWGVARLSPELSGALTSPHTSPDSALDTLRQRYTRGEISKNEYDEMSRVLQSQ